VQWASYVHVCQYKPRSVRRDLVFNVEFVFLGRASYLSWAFAVGMSVRLAVRATHSWVTPKRFKISKYFLHPTIEGCFQFLGAKFHNTEFRG